ncbi:hypothetical protein UFOVP1666_152 [uncultured Caudovirales phage]|uniref:Uncharacterized protein n=1 Tax=uncultured Caudovirales phage TaxID=2100421 RepID=A0A6J5PEZ2_9CAUD|nr:hypothetical protein UFOVP867_107 [uncultured Caudovirales phage]CAB4170713.1 hypothetical protein UFOVP913_91 [uncultured Caudovirales phage]CAB4177046.1 hypothetical protein UFOVP993_144 [uncultured Caudovirales phage]CAB4223182.1 hypothetical protein UFOVP1666_152 [uncultured Caudovirales phage]
MDALDKYELNHITVELKMAEFELIKMKEIDAVGYGENIKSKLRDDLSRQLINKISFTKSKDPNMDSTSFKGRVWIFNDIEMDNLIADVKHALVTRYKQSAVQVSDLAVIAN